MHDPTPTRRELIMGAMASALAGSASVEPADSGLPPIIDTHVHLWDLSKFQLHWLAGAPRLNRSFLWDDYQQAANGTHIVKCVYMEVDVDPSQQEREALAVVELCRRGGTMLAGAVISGRPASSGFSGNIKALARNPEIKGVRQVLHGPGTPAGYCLDPAFIKGIALLGELGLSFDLCMRSGELRDGAKLATACPATSFVLDHCGNARVFGGDLFPWKKDIAAVAERPNTNCKVSGIVASTGGRAWKSDDLAPIINHVLEVFGPERVVFGGD